MFKLSLAWLSLVHFGSGKMDFRATAAHNTNSKSTPRSSAKTDTQFWWVPVVTSAKPFVRLRNNVSPPHNVQHALGDSAWHHPRSLLETIIATHRPWFRCMCARTAVTVYSATVWKADLIRRGRNATSHPYPWPSAAAGAALSDWSVWHGNHFQNPKNRPAKKLEGALEGGEEARPLRYPFRLLVLRSPRARSISPNDFKIKQSVSIAIKHRHSLGQSRDGGM